MNLRNYGQPHEMKKTAFPRNYLFQALKQPSRCNFSSCASGRVFSKRFHYSTSCQPSLEAWDISTGEPHKESPMQQAGPPKLHLEGTIEEPLSNVVLLQKTLDQDLKRLPLKSVVQSCVKRWFREHLKNALKGDSDAQIMVGQMISYGYGVPKDVDGGIEWIKRGRSCKQKHSRESSEKKRPEDEDLYFMCDLHTGKPPSCTPCDHN